jgi:Glycosyl transferase family 2/N-terminal domain of galactosyltransferase
MRLPLAVIVGIRANAAEADRARNVRLCLDRLNCQENIPRSQFQTILIEQDHAPQLNPETVRLADRFQFAYNAGAYNRGWAFNIGANVVAREAEYLLFLDADVLLQRDCLRRTLDILRGGCLAVRPYSEAMFLDPDSTARTVRAWPRLPDANSLSGSLFVNPMGLCIAVEAGFYDRVGGHDERFEGWGWEDREFWERIERQTAIGRLPDRIFHLHHASSPLNEQWGASNQSLFFASLNGGHTVSKENSKGCIDKYMRGTPDVHIHAIEEIKRHFGCDARVVTHVATLPRDGALERARALEPENYKRWFGCSIAKDPGRYTDIAVFLNQARYDAEISCAKFLTGPRISVVMPTYYRLHTLLGAVAGLRAQTYSNWELILVDNAGDCNYFFADPRIRVFADTGCRSAAYARNSGVKRATGDFVCFFDDDDFMFPSYLEHFVSAFLANPNTAMVRCGMRKPDGWDNFTYATPECCLRHRFATPTWVPQHGHDQIYFKTIAEKNGWSVENGQIRVIGEVLCAAGFDSRGGLRRGEL